ncbi:MAG: outer membrane beta-barrel protein [Bacteroidales bacterium]|nr:outer membrane beta-barrel protein [Bacteroidales bacterium]
MSFGKAMRLKWQYYSVLVLLFLFCGIRTEAQGLRFMLDFTPQLNWFQSNNPARVHTKGSTFGYDVGLQFNYFFSQNYAFVTGIKIFHTGGRLSYADTIELAVSDRTLTVPANTPVTYRNEYVHLPLGIHLESVEIGYLSFYFETGASLLFRFNTWINVDGITDIKENGTEDINMFNLAYFARGGVMYSLGGKTAITGGVSYVHGLMDMTKDPGGGPEDRLIFHSLGLRLGIVF